jgi:ribose/xylose/arabinose/galactoside ABC-type transport system permease subunit
MFSGIRPWDLAVMLALLATIFAFEMLGVFNAHYVTLTQIIKTFIPMPVRIMIAAWLLWHFVLSDLVTAIINRTPVQ